MLFSPSTQYAILALSYLASVPSRIPRRVVNIAEEAGVPAKFLAKILTQLKNSRIVKSIKGPGGGYLLNREPEEIRLIDIILAIDSNHFGDGRCVLGLDACQDEHPCPLHVEWKAFKVDVQKKFHALTLRELAAKLTEKRAHLRD